MPANTSMGQRAPTLLVPGQQVVKDQNGTITTFGGFPLVRSREQFNATVGRVIGLYGKGGSGKTTITCRMADPILNPEGFECPIGVLDFEAGVESVAYLLGERMQQLQMKTVGTHERPGDLVNFINAAKVTPKEEFPWSNGTLVLDNGSELLNQALREQGYHNRSKEGGGPTSSQPDYNAVTTIITDILRDLRDLSISHGCNIILLLWEAYDRTESGSLIGVKSDLTPKLAIRVQGILGYIAHLEVLKDATFTRHLSFAPNDVNGVAYDGKMRRDPTDKLAQQIPFDLYNMPSLLPIFNTLKRGVPFPASKYTRSAARQAV